MRHVNFAKEIVDFAKTITTEQKGLLKNKIGELMGKCENSKEFILSMGYAIHFADTPSTPLLFAPIFMVMGIDEASENARAVYSNAKTINTLRPHVKKMILDASRDQDVETLTKDVMCAVYYSQNKAQQELILNMTKAMLENLNKKNNELDINTTANRYPEIGL